VYQTVFGKWLVILPVSYALLTRPFEFGAEIRNTAAERRRAILFAFEALVLIGIVPAQGGVSGAVINNLLFPVVVFLIASVSYWFLRPTFGKTHANFYFSSYLYAGGFAGLANHLIGGPLFSLVTGSSYTSLVKWAWVGGVISLIIGCFYLYLACQWVAGRTRATLGRILLTLLIFPLGVTFGIYLLILLLVLLGNMAMNS
jgi:hypothetical protein